MEKKVIGTADVLQTLKNKPDNEQQYTHYLGGCLRSTHWLVYKSETQKIGDSTDWKEYYWMTEAEFLEEFAGHQWSRDC